MAEIRDVELTCLRCGGPLERGYLNAGKGPFRWVYRPDQHATIFGGDHLTPPRRVWGRRAIPWARCPQCRFGVFAYDAI